MKKTFFNKNLQIKEIIISIKTAIVGFILFALITQFHLIEQPNEVSDVNIQTKVPSELKDSINQYMVTYDDGRLKFKDFPDYETAVIKLSNLSETDYTEWVKLKNFSNSLRSSILNNPNTNLSNFELASVLNTDYVLQIRNFVFKVNYADSSIYTVNEKDITNKTFDDLIVSKNEAVMMYSFNDDVIGLMQDDTEQKRVCGETNRSNSSITYWSPDFSFNNQTYRVQVDFQYRNSGIWNTLKIEFYGYKEVGGGGCNSSKKFEKCIENTNRLYLKCEEIGIRFDKIESKIKRRCKDCQRTNEDDPQINYFYRLNETDAPFDNSRFLRIRYHQGTRGLHYYYINAKISVSANTNDNNSWVSIPEIIFESWFDTPKPCW